MRRDEARVTPHQLDDADTVWQVAHRLGARRADRVLGGLDGRIESKGAVDDVQVIVDRLGNTSHRQPQPLLHCCEADNVGRAVCAVAPDDVQLRDTVALAEVERLVQIEAAAG